MIKTVRLKPLPPDIPDVSLPTARLRHGRRHACLALLILILNHPILSFALSLFLLLGLSPLLTVPTALLQRCRHRYTSITGVIAFPLLNRRPCVAEPKATFPSSDGTRALRSLIPLSAIFFLPQNFLRLPQTSPRPLPLAQTKSSNPC